MANFTVEELFGSFATIDSSQPGAGTLTIQLSNFLYSSDAMPPEKGVFESSTMEPVQILYGLLLMLMNVQAPKIDDVVSQRVYIANAGKSLARGNREGQIKQSFTISFFLDSGFAGIPSINQIDEYGGNPPEFYE